MSERSLEGFHLSEEAVKDAVALLTVEITAGAAETRVEARRVLALRDGEDVRRQMLRIVSTISLMGTLAAEAFTLAAGMRNVAADLPKDAPDGWTGLQLVQRYARRLALSENRRLAIFLRCYDSNYRPPGLENWYCPVCSCGKSGHAEEPNPWAESCQDHDCPCHVLDLYVEPEDGP